MRYLLTFSYDGSNFHGFQRQKNLKSVQGTLEEALSFLLRSNIQIKGSGRTDAGVHALKQTAHFDFEEKIDSSFLFKLNDYLQKEINVISIEEVPKDFHARFSVRRKTYKYLINLDRNCKDSKYYFISYASLNIEKMKEASKLFLGIHDFKNFVSGKREDYSTYIENITIEEKDKILSLEFTGTGFYRYMIRHLSGALYDIGREKATLETIKKMLDNSIEKNLSVLPASGLYLIDINY